MKHTLLVTIIALASSASGQVHLLHPDDRIDRITFGSCARQDTEQPILDQIADENSDVFLFIGDNVYCDLNRVIPTNRQEMKRAWDALAVKPIWQRFSRSQPVLATWDDHDFGLNDAGKEWLETEPGSHAQQLFLDFFGDRADSERRTRVGIYDAAIVGPPGQRVQIILLDTRSFRTELSRSNPRPKGLGPYTAITDGSGTLLGEAQWQWLEAELAKPAEVRVIASSIQLIADEHGWETWGNMPHERDRLYQIIDEADASGVIVVSGDRHLMELSVDRTPAAPYPIYDFTSSGLNWDDKPRPVNEPNSHQIAGPVRQVNYGLITIDWNEASPADTLIEFVGRGADDTVFFRENVKLGNLNEAMAHTRSK
ncbi:MAG: alkaline phosphatase D family protein [Planctomycetota bacterium]